MTIKWLPFRLSLLNHLNLRDLAFSCVYVRHQHGIPRPSRVGCCESTRRTPVCAPGYLQRPRREWSVIASTTVVDTAQYCGGGGAVCCVCVHVSVCSCIHGSRGAGIGASVLCPRGGARQGQGWGLARVGISDHSSCSYRIVLVTLSSSTRRRSMRWPEPAPWTPLCRHISCLTFSATTTERLSSASSRPGRGREVCPHVSATPISAHAPPLPIPQPLDDREAQRKCLTRCVSWGLSLSALAQSWHGQHCKWLSSQDESRTL